MKHPHTGQIVASPDEVKEIWQKHLMQVLNNQQLDNSTIKSPFESQAVLNIDLSLIIEEEIDFTIKKLKNGEKEQV